MSKPYLSVVIPSYNEAANVQRGVLDSVIAYLKEQDYSWEVILSDDGSSDSTLEELKAFSSRHPQVKVLANVHAGKGPTVQSGMLAAKGEWRLFTDFDQSTPIAELEKLWPHITKASIMIGSRELAGSTRDKEPWYRHIMGRGFNWLVQLLAIPGVFDTQCGFKLFSQESAEDLFSKMVVYGRQKERNDAFTGAFDVELLFLARKYGYRVKEIPIHWNHFETDRVNPLKDSVRMLLDILKIRAADFQGKYPK
jgi:dolichyl-phosphate beta-glucosyltransferase